MSAPGAARRLLLLGTLYFAQGLPFGFFVQALPVLLRSAGVSLDKIGLAALLSLPWALKFLWAPIVDRRWWPRLGRRRTWILGMQLAATVVLAGLATAPGTDALAVLMAAMVVLNLIAATQDIATDGLAVELLAPAERGVANGLQVAGYRIGMIVGGGVLLGMYAELGHRGLFAVMAALTALSSLPVLTTPEPTTAPASAPGVAPLPTATAGGAPRPPHFLRLPGAGRVLALVVLYKLGDALAQGMLRPFLVDRGLGLGDIAWIVGTIGSVAGMAGALAGGWLAGRLGRRRALVLFAIGQIVAVAGYAVLARGAPPSVTALAVWSGVEHLAGGMATAALFTAMMDWCRPAHSGTDYTVQASAVVVATGVANALSGFVAGALGYAGHFALATAITGLGLVAAVALFPRAPFPPSPRD